MRRWLFDLAYLLAGLVLAPWLLFKAATTGKYRAGIGRRFGNLPARRSGRRTIWVHAVSVGELLAARPLIRALQQRRPDLEIAVTYTTKTAAEIAERELPDLWHSYSPLDLSQVVRRFFRTLDPALIVLMELELWPNWLMEARRRGVPVLVANGRISDKSFRGYRRAAGLLRPAFEGVSHWGMQDAVYAERAARLAATGQKLRKRYWLRDDAGRWWIGGQELSPAARERLAGGTEPEPATGGDGPALFGVPMVAAPVSESGNLKYDSLRGEPDEEKAALFRRLFGLAEGETVLVCGSTHPGEHEALAEMLPRLSNKGIRCVLVPRHPERYESARKLLSQAGLSWRNRSELTETSPAGPGTVILLDTVGELAAVYGLADLVFVGGSLIPHGGQNMAEPAALGKATLFGPHTANFRVTVRDLLECGGAVRVENAAELEGEILRLAADTTAREAIGRAGQARLLASRGALGRYLALVEKLLA